MYHFTKKSKIIFITIIALVIVCSIVLAVAISNRNIDVSNCNHFIVIENNANFYQKPKLENVKIYCRLNLGDKVYLLNSFIRKRRK